MGKRPIARRRNKNPTLKVSRKPKGIRPSEISFGGAHPLIKQYWNPRLTLRQNYQRMGLVASLGGDTGGSETRAVEREQGRTGATTAGAAQQPDPPADVSFIDFEKFAEMPDSSVVKPGGGVVGGKAVLVRRRAGTGEEGDHAGADDEDMVDWDSEDDDDELTGDDRRDVDGWLHDEHVPVPILPIARKIHSKSLTIVPAATVATLYEHARKPKPSSSSSSASTAASTTLASSSSSSSSSSSGANAPPSSAADAEIPIAVSLKKRVPTLPINVAGTMEEQARTAAAAGRQPHPMSENQMRVFQDMIAKHGTNIAAIARDRKVNKYQFSEGQLRKKLRAAGLLNN